MMNFYRPLTAALSGNPKALPWKPDMETAFTATKAALVAMVPLAHLFPKAFLALATDVSDYSTFDRELLAAVSGIKQFRSIA
jgi:hypothetical protein